MPSYDLPKAEKTDEKEEAVDAGLDSWRHKIHGIPANEEIIESVEVGKKFTIVLQGTVCSAELRKTDGNGALGSFDLDVDSVRVSTRTGNDFEKLSEDE